MPQLADVLKNRAKKKFVKKDYRATDVDLDIKKDPVNASTVEEEVKPSIPKKEDHIQVTIEEHSDNNEITSREPLDNIEVTSREQLDNTEITSREQLDNTAITSREQSDNTPVTSREQLDNQQITKTEDLDNNQADLTPSLDNNPPTTVNKPEKIKPQKTLTLSSFMVTGEEERYQRVSGIQKKILDTVIAICKEKDSLSTGNIESNKLAQYLDISYGSLKTSLSRLIKKGLVQRGKGKPSHGGFIILNISEELKNMSSFEWKEPQQILEEEQSSNNSSSSNNKTITTDTNEEDDEWLTINVEPLSHIGFRQTQVMQIKNKNVSTPDIVQHSINHFAYGLAHNPKVQKYNEPLNVLMGVLIRGGQWTEQNYRSPQELAQEERLKQLKVQIEREQALDNSIKEAEFALWLRKITSEEKESILSKIKLPPALREEKAEQFLRSHFENEIYKK